MTPAEFKEGVGAYALGALEPEERKDFDEFISSDQLDPSCLEALEVARRAADALGASLPPVKPGQEVWQTIEETITMMPKRAVPEAAGGMGPMVRQVFPWAIAASLFLVTLLMKQQVNRLDAQVAVLTNTSASLANQVTSIQAENAYLMGLTNRDGVKLASFSMQGHPEMRASLVMHAGVKQCLVIATGMKAQKNKVYTLWFIRHRDIGIFQVAALFDQNS